jgi:hypothetical protein
MAHSYTPGLRVASHTKLERRRILPLKGKVTVQVGDRVDREDVVAKTDLPGDVTTVNVINRLGIQAQDIESYMVKKVGESVGTDELIAETTPLIKWFKSSVNSPVTGVIESVSTITGQVIIRHPPKPVSVMAYISGVVTEVLPEEGVVIETEGAFVQGIFGVGSECWGPVEVICESADEEIGPNRITSDHKGKVLIAGSLATAALMRKAMKVEAAGLIAGGVDAEDLKDVLGYDLGVAITGTEDIPTSIIVTEGFGKVGIAHRTFQILSDCAGKIASINGATQIRAGVLRPEIIANSTSAPEEAVSSDGGLEIGNTIRIIREPYFGKLGAVSDLPSELVTVESGTHVRVLEVVFDDGSKAVVPRANVESITL